MEKWYKNVYRRQLTDMHISDMDENFLSSFNAEEYCADLVKAKIQSPMIYLQSHTGLCNFKTDTARTHKFFEKHPQKINRLIEKCHERGMKVVGYYSLIFNNWAADRHPEWEMRYADHTTWRMHGQRYGLCCPNNGEYREFVEKQIKEIAAAFPALEGMFYDMPYWEVVCRCPACRERWEKEVGGDLPEENWQDDRWLKFLRKRQDWMAEFAGFVRRVSLKNMPQTTVEFNFAAVIGCDWVAGSAEGINAASEFAGGDLYGDLYNHSFTCKYYYGVTKNQPFEYMTCRCNKNLREHTILKPAEMLETEILLTCAHHGATLLIDAIDPVGSLDERVYERAGKVFEKQLPYEKWMDTGELYAEVGIYFDSRTQFPDEICGTYNKLCAVNAHRTLAENHIPVAILGNGSVKNAKKLKFVIAPLLRKFENDEILFLAEYVKEGGVLYLSGSSDPRLIETFFGGVIENYTFGDSEYAHTEKGFREVQAYIAPEKSFSRIFGEFNAQYPMPITYKLPIMKGGKGKVKAKIVLPWSDPDDNMHFSSIHSNPPWRATEYPAVTETRYGKGKVVWSAAAIENEERSNFKEVFIRLLKRYAGKSLFKIEGSKEIECVIFESGREYLVSFIDLRKDRYSRKKIRFSFSDGRKFIAETCSGKIVKPACKNDRYFMQLDINGFEMYKIRQTDIR